MLTFKEKVIKIVSGIQKGRTLTYKEVAKKAGNEKAARAVGMIMSKNQDKKIPCHRVIRSDGDIGKYNYLQGKSKRVLLDDEKESITKARR